MIESKSTDKLFLLTNIVKNIDKEILEDILTKRKVTVKIRWVEIKGMAVPDVILEISDK